MKKKLGILLLVLVTGAGYGQVRDTTALGSVPMDTLLQDSIVKEPPAHLIGGYAFAEFQIAPNYRGYNESVGLGFGAQYDRWIVGFSVVDFKGVIEEFVIFPSVFELDYRYAGPFVGYEVLKSQTLSLEIQASLQFGDMIWRRKETGVDFFRDEFSVATLRSKIKYEGIRFAKPYVQIGYQQANNLDLEIVNNSDFEGFVFVFGLQIGYFNQ